MKGEIFIKRFISEVPENVSLLQDEMINRQKDTLVLGPTGVGKTVAFIKAMENLSKEHLNIFLVPNRNQALQLQTDTLHFAIVGGIEYNTIIEKINEGERILYCVYDKADIISNLIHNKEYSFQYNLVIDEAHCLIQDYFRKEAINKVIELKSKVDSCILTTATPDILLKSKYIQITKTISFKREQSNEAFNNMYFVNYKRENRETLYESLASYILSLDGKYDGIQIRINDTKFIQNFSIYFYGKENYEIYDVDSKQKDFDKNGFCNELYDNIVRRSTFPYKEGKINIYLHTSLLDAGTNISSFAGKNVLTIYVMNSIHAYNLDSISQCLNRIRFKHDCCIFSFETELEEQEYKSYNQIRNTYKKALEGKVKAYNQLLKAQKDFFIIDYWDEIERQIAFEDFATGLLKQKNLITGKSYSEGCLYFDQETQMIITDGIKEENQIYIKYQNQYYYCREDFLNELETLFGKNFEVFNISSLKNKEEKSLLSSTKYASKVITELTGDDLKDLYENNKNKKLQSINKSKYYCDLKAIEEINKVLDDDYTYTDIQKHIDTFAGGISFKKQREQLEIQVLKNLLKEYKLKKILHFWNNYDDLKESCRKTEGKLIDYIRVLKHSSFVSSLSDMIYDRETNLEVLKNCNSAEEIKEEVLKHRVYNVLKDFRRDTKEALDDEKFIRAIYDYLNKEKIVNGEKQFKGTTITEEVMQTLKTIIRNSCKDKYTEKQIIQTIKMIFLCQYKDEKLQVRGIKKIYSKYLL